MFIEDNVVVIIYHKYESLVIDRVRMAVLNEGEISINLVNSVGVGGLVAEHGEF